MIEVWKILHKKEDVDPSTWFNLATENSERETRMTSNPWNFKAQSFKTETRNNFFSVRTLAPWNNLPSEVKSATNINRYDKWQKKTMMCKPEK